MKEAECRECNSANGGEWCKSLLDGAYSCIEHGQNKSLYHVECKTRKDQCALGSWKFCEEMVDQDTKMKDRCSYNDSFTSCASTPITNKDKCPPPLHSSEIAPAVGDMILYNNDMMLISGEQYSGYRLSGQNETKWFHRSEFVVGWNNFTGNKVTGNRQGGGAIFVDTSDKNMRNREDLKPTITDTVFVENHAARAMGSFIVDGI